jgi:hypothetical protein
LSILAKLLAARDTRYFLTHAYFEFENVEDPDDEVTTPTISSSLYSSCLPYYLGLSESLSRDYVREPITTLPLISSTYGELPAEIGNKFEYLIQCPVGQTGVNGKPFSNADNSKLVGLALVSAVNPSDPTKDVVWGRMYLDTNEQRIIPTTGAISGRYGITFELES